MQQYSHCKQEVKELFSQLSDVLDNRNAANFNYTKEPLLKILISILALLNDLPGNNKHAIFIALNKNINDIKNSKEDDFTSILTTLNNLQNNLYYKAINYIENIFFKDIFQFFYNIKNILNSWEDNLTDISIIDKLNIELELLSDTSLNEFSIIAEYIQLLKKFLNKILLNEDFEFAYNKLVSRLSFLEDLNNKILQNKEICIDEKILRETTDYLNNPVDNNASLELENIIDEELIDIFIEEANEIIAEIYISLAKWNKDIKNIDNIKNIQRELHTLKGNSRMVEINSISEKVHELEEFLNKALSTKTINNDTIKFSEECIKYIEKIINNIKTNTEFPVQSFSQQESDSPRDKYLRININSLEKVSNLSLENIAYIDNIKFQTLEIINSIYDIKINMSHLKKYIKKITQTPLDSISNKESINNHFNYLLTNNINNTITELSQYFQNIYDATYAINDVLFNQNKTNDEIQNNLTRTRLIPFNDLIPRLQKIISQIAKELGKELDFEVNYVKGTFDRILLDKIIPLLEHLIRNAIDHGIEDKQERKSIGKNEKGNIALSLSRQGNKVTIIISDDGRGLDKDKIIAKAIEKKLIMSDANLKEKEIFNFILHPGFTTRDKVTAISGLGIGMDVVNNEINKLGGTIDISSVKNNGTKFTLNLPFTILRCTSLIFKVSNRVFAIPLDNIEAVSRVNIDYFNMFDMEFGPKFNYLNNFYKLIYLGKLLNLNDTPKNITRKKLPVLLVKYFGKSFGIIVDELYPSQELIIHNLKNNFFQTTNGATLLNGKVVVLLDLNYLLSNINGIKKSSSFKDPKSKGLIMIVDDSIAIRNIISNIIKKNGYQVITAQNGLDAMYKLSDNFPDIILLDIEMPHMNGFELTKYIRNENRLANLPIIMISSKNDSKDIEYAENIGVNYFISKPFQEDKLISYIEKCLSIWKRTS